MPRAANEVTARTGIHLPGRRTYELMRCGGEPPEGMSEVELEFQRAWAPAQKVAYWRSIDEVGPNARIEREFDPVAARAVWVIPDDVRAVLVPIERRDFSGGIVRLSCLVRHASWL